MRPVVLVVLLVDAALLGLTELAWLTLRIGSVPLPVSALVAALTTPVLVRAAGRVGGSGRWALALLGVWALAVLVPGLASPAGAGMLPPDWRAIVLFAAGILPGVSVAMWPLPRAADPVPA